MLSYNSALNAMASAGVASDRNAICNRNGNVMIIDYLRHDAGARGGCLSSICIHCGGRTIRKYFFLSLLPFPTPVTIVVQL